uniref:Fibronectin type III domain containing 4a n=1 Tax=Sphaeramia orbicularis TaxID=375764 RepID=A0A673BM55_9TELE
TTVTNKLQSHFYCQKTSSAQTIDSSSLPTYTPMSIHTPKSKKHDPTVQGLDKSRHLQTGEMIIIVVVLVMWAAVIALFCRQYDIIKDNDSSNNKEKAKPSSERSTPEHHSGGLLRSKVGTSLNSDSDQNHIRCFNVLLTSENDALS